MAYQEGLGQPSCEFTGVSGQSIGVYLYTIVSIVCASEDLCATHVNVHIRM